MKILILGVFLVFASCAPTYYTAWADNQHDLMIMQSDIQSSNTIIKIINHNGIYEIRYTDKKDK